MCLFYTSFMSLRGGSFSRRSNLILCTETLAPDASAGVASLRRAHLPWRAVPGRALLAMTSSYHLRYSTNCIGQTIQSFIDLFLRNNQRRFDSNGLRAG